MEQIGFKNFRKFADFQAMDIAPITILVGENNAGKSTVVKGILAFSDFLNGRHDYQNFYKFNEFEEVNDDKRKEQVKEMLKSIRFYFNTSYLAHIGTFKRALYYKASDDSITFKTKRGFMELEVKVTGKRDDDEAVSGIVSEVRIYLEIYKLSMSFNLISDTATITFHPGQSDAIGVNPRMRENLIKYFNSFDKDYSVKAEISNNWRPGRSNLIESLLDSLQTSINATIYPYTEHNDGGDIELLRRGHLSPIPIEGVDEETKTFLKSFSETTISGKPMLFWAGEVHDRFMLPSLRGLINSMMDIEYLYAHAVTQTVIYSAKDTNDYLSRTIHEYASQQSKSKKYFIIKWMKEFGIGTDFIIRSVGGEAHIVYITNEDGEKVNLADKGMGSIQLMVLLFRLAITLPDKGAKRVGKMFYSAIGKVIIIEEPEQNLHPKLQSKLADLFFELNKQYGYRFIIETHSEYLIRKTQVIVKNITKGDNKALNKNPFKIYYFNREDEKPYYEIVYQEDGNFANDFGTGFFDEATNLAIDIL